MHFALQAPLSGGKPWQLWLLLLGQPLRVRPSFCWSVFAPSWRINRIRGAKVPRRNSCPRETSVERPRGSLLSSALPKTLSWDCLLLFGPGSLLCPTDCAALCLVAVTGLAPLKAHGGRSRVSNRRHGKLQEFIEKPAGISEQPLRTTSSPRCHTAWRAQNWSAGARFIGRIRIQLAIGLGARSEPLLQRWRL